MITGRPVIFIGTVVGGWTLLRLAMLLPVPVGAIMSAPAFVETMPRPIPGGSGRYPTEPPAGLVSYAGTNPPRAMLASRQPKTIAAMPGASPIAAYPVGGGWSSMTADAMLNAQMAFARAPRGKLALAAFAPGAGLSPREAGVPGPPGPSSSDRWMGAAWMLWRHDDQAGLARGARLGGSQAGLRLDYALDPDTGLRPALYARASSALNGLAAAEAAVGVAIRPRLPLPVTIAIERREAVSEGGRSDFALIAAGGVDRVAIGHGFRLDGYGQAGVVGTNRRDAFIDGRLTVERSVVGAPDIALGAGLWGGAQPGVSRIDVGPQASFRLHVGGANLRLGAEWREQVAGDAAPSSGPAVTIGADF